MNSALIWWLSWSRSRLISGTSNETGDTDPITRRQLSRSSSGLIRLEAVPAAAEAAAEAGEAAAAAAAALPCLGSWYVWIGRTDRGAKHLQQKWTP